MLNSSVLVSTMAYSILHYDIMVPQVLILPFTASYIIMRIFISSLYIDIIIYYNIMIHRH